MKRHMIYGLGERKEAETWAREAIPSFLPVKPRPSVVVALREMESRGRWQSAARDERMARA